jgi:hypothetical protein
MPQPLADYAGRAPAGIKVRLDCPVEQVAANVSVMKGRANRDRGPKASPPLKMRRLLHGQPIPQAVPDRMQSTVSPLTIGAQIVYGRPLAATQIFPEARRRKHGVFQVERA